MSFSFSTVQVIAWLFTTGGTVHVAVEDAPPPHEFRLENSEAGPAALVERLVPLRDPARESFFCIGTAPDVELEGVLAQELLSAPVRRFLVARGMYADFAKREGLDPGEAQTLLRACRALFPNPAS